MNVSVETLEPCKRLVRFELDAPEVDKVFAEVEQDYLKRAALPGFRKGKAPKEVVLKSFAKDIDEEVKRRVVSDSYTKAVKDNNLNVIGYPDIEEVDFGRGKPLQFVAKIEIYPEFELPEYRGLLAKRETTTVTDDDVHRAVESLREQRAKFDKVDRAAQDGDIIVVNYTGTCEGKPIIELAPTAKGLTEQKGFWIEARKDAFIPGFSDQLLGAKAGDKRTVTVDFPADFVQETLSGKKGVYEVEVVEVRVRVLPELDEAFAKGWEAESVEKLRDGVRRDLQNELNQKKKRSIRNQIVRTLVGQVKVDLPESVVQRETRNVVYEIVNENQRRGVAREIIDKEKDQIYAAAAQSAKERVKVGFVFHKIAEKEGIRATKEELNARIVSTASAYQMPVDKFVKELEKRDGFSEIYQQIIHEKVLDFLHENARFEDVAPGQAPE